MLELITDRTAQDVQRWQELKAKGYAAMTPEERAEWDTSKGAYNYTDLNRVEDAVAYLAARLNALGYRVVIPYTRTWAVTDVPTVADMTRYLENVRAIRAAYTRFSTTPAAPASMNKLTYETANDIEQILKDVETLIENMVAAFTYSGDIYGGEI